MYVQEGPVKPEKGCKQQVSYTPHELPHYTYRQTGPQLKEI